VLTLSNVTKTHAGGVVLSEVSLSVTPRSRIGVVGPNGVGKSTLLRVLAGLEPVDAGKVTRTPASLRVGYLPQEPELAPGERLLPSLARRTGVGAAGRELDRLTAALERDSGLAEAYSAALERFLALGGADFHARARAVCADVGLGRERLDQPLQTLSGGEAARAALAAILLARFDVFLLDEPTNNLDYEGLDRLERFVDSLAGALVVVSHDRDFLDRTVTSVVEIEEGSHRIREYAGDAGGWSEYEAARGRARADQYRRYDEAQERRRELDALLRARRGQAQAGDSLGRKTGGADRRGTQALRSKVRQAERALARVADVEKPFEPWELRLKLAPERRSGDVVARLEGAVVERGGFRLGPIDMELRWGDRLSLAGPNGSGKTTLLRALLGELPLAEGNRRLGAGTVVGELDQGRQAFLTAEPVLAAFRDLSIPEARSLLAKFGLGADDVQRPATSLSPGERTRAALALLVARRVNCLVLDEPTNHLDLPAIEELERALVEFPGAVVLVTHDRRFLEAFQAARTVELSGYGVT
jgi:ATPase subunit of ABC transporter with duplicated ATPase domains